MDKVSPELTREVLRLMIQDGVTLTGDLNQCESRRAGSGRVGAKSGGGFDRGALSGEKNGYEGSSRRCGCGAQRFVEHRPRTLATTLGLVTVRRSYYRCSRCCTSSAPYDEQVGLGAEAVSGEMARAALLLAVHHPFRQAADLLKALIGQSVSSKSIHRLMVRVGQTACEQEDQEAEGMKRWQPCAAEVQPPRLYVTTDGVMVRLEEGFKEVKVVTCYGETSPGRPFKRHRVRFESAEPFAAYAWSLACRCGLAKAGETVLLGDGAAWIWEHVGGVLGEHTTHIVDGYHAMQHVWDCGRALYGEGTGQTAAWVKKVECSASVGNGVFRRAG